MKPEVVEGITSILNSLDVLEKYAVNFRRYHEMDWTYGVSASTVDEFLVRFVDCGISFPWSSTEEGSMFWRNVYYRMLAKSEYANVHIGRALLLFKKLGVYDNIKKYFAKKDPLYKAIRYLYPNDDMVMKLFMARATKDDYFSVTKNNALGTFIHIFDTYSYLPYDERIQKHNRLRWSIRRMEKHYVDRTF